MTDDALSRLRALHEAAPRWDAELAAICRDDIRRGTMAHRRADDEAHSARGELASATRAALPALLAVAEAAEEVLIAAAVLEGAPGAHVGDGTFAERTGVVSSWDALRAALDSLRKVTL